MNYLKQLAILLACCVAGDALSILMHGALPGNVLGLALLCCCWFSDGSSHTK